MGGGAVRVWLTFARLGVIPTGAAVQAEGGISRADRRRIREDPAQGPSPGC